MIQTALQQKTPGLIPVLESAAHMTTNFAALSGLIEHALLLKDWGFTKSADFDSGAGPVVVYDSHSCRIRFHLERDGGNENLSIQYGRLHAPVNAQVMQWRGAEHYCWYGEYELQLAFQFLDGYSPQEAFNTRWIFFQVEPDCVDPELEGIVDSALEQSLNLHAALLGHYGLRLFELFDLRRPALWEQYLLFLKEFYKLMDDDNRARGIKSLPYGLPAYKFC